MGCQTRTRLLFFSALLLLASTGTLVAGQGTSTTGVGAEIAGPLPSNLTNATVLGAIPDILADYVVLVRLLLTGAPTTTPKPSDDSGGLGLVWILLITLGGVIVAVLLGLMIYNTVVARQMQDITKTAPAAQASGLGAYVKVIQGDLGHA